MDVQALLSTLGADPALLGAGERCVTTPIDGSEIATLADDTPDTVSEKIGVAASAFLAWRGVPAPRRGELIRVLGDELRAHKSVLGRLVSIESGKILVEGEVQEMIDICDFALGLSRQLYGLIPTALKIDLHASNRAFRLI